MSPTALRRLAIFDVLGISLLIGWYIWRLQFSAPRVWTIFPVWVAASFLVHGDTPRTLGWRADNLWPATRQAAALFAIFAVLLGATGLVLGAPDRRPPNMFTNTAMWP
jgi:hypothetical protein